MSFLANFGVLPILALAYLFAACSTRTVGRMGRGLGGLLLALGFRKKIVSTNLELALGKEMSAAERERLLKDVYAHVGTLFLEIARNFGLSRRQMLEDFLISDSCRERVRSVLSQGKGAVFITGHIANWELFAMAMAASGVPLSLVVKKMNNAVSQALIERQRKRTGLEIIYSGGAIEKMKENLRRQRGIGFMVDQNTTGKKGIRVNFFGVPASSIRGLAALARDTGVPIVPVYSVRLPDGKHEMRMHDPLPYLEASELPRGSPERLAREEWLNTQQYQAAIEAMVREKPEQWLWIHRRWKTSREPLNEATAHLENL
jgi:KDO2-lipid IV(A) lauroyltransferase